ncbi:hypothetical protein FS749_016792 [Ceratobasidium sp. UAMH 11750]|nr:hypothetical protein FS749_016792 [Ceratobasidium sp. UAMH 11750]
MDVDPSQCGLLGLFASTDMHLGMANSKIESLRRASVAKEAAMAKSRALDIALQIATKDAEEAKQQTMKMHDAWMSRLEKVIPELPDDPGVRAGFFNMVFEETHATMMEREAKLQAQIRAVHEKEAHVIQLEKELVLLKKEMDRMKSMDADSRVKELMAKFRQS